MRIEDVTPEALKDKNITDRILLDLRHRCIQIHMNNFEGNNRAKWEDLERTDFMAKYKLVRTEMARRKFPIPTTTSIDIALFKSAMRHVNVSKFGKIPVIKNYISIGGQYLETPKAAEAIEVIIQDSEDTRCEDLEQAVAALILKDTGLPAAFTYAPEGPGEEHIPLFDLILNNREKTERIKTEKRTVDIQKPEVTETQIRIPVGNPCDVTATISIDADRGIQALYCGQEKRIRTYLFDKEKWTMATARAWIKEQKKKKIDKKLGDQIEDYEYLIHHIETEGKKEIIHHCQLLDHMGNLFELAHIWIDKGKIYFDGKEIKEGHYHVIKGLEPTQEVTWSDEEAAIANIKPKRMIPGMTLKEKAREW